MVCIVPPTRASSRINQHLPAHGNGLQGHLLLSLFLPCFVFYPFPIVFTIMAPWCIERDFQHEHDYGYEYEHVAMKKAAFSFFPHIAMALVVSLELGGKCLK
ncbi:hypothetical protein BDW02DRAFT_71533 [Decorospora gaudefroyi]|uniref:Uncharacterized protein n=1 Tax=Decorospora gaudefroyi TaxID=184978 RepID=A0A6A5KCE9_9PLEO|nr:hypothetical protein BDW02DRAFT_71533 [Decorospora gaudefroyi]